MARRSHIGIMSLKLKAAAFVIGALASLVYLLNPGAGVFELLPDALPLVGNLDEAAFVTILLASVRGLRRLRKEKQLAASPRSRSPHGHAPAHSPAPGPA